MVLDDEPNAAAAAVVADLSSHPIYSGLPVPALDATDMETWAQTHADNAMQVV